MPPIESTLTGSGYEVSLIGSSAVIGVGTFAQMKALTGMNNGALYRVTNYGRPYSLWQYSLSVGNWFPIAPLLAYEKTGTTEGVSQTADQVLLAITAEAGLLLNKRFRLFGALAKNGTTDTLGTVSVRMGTAGSVADAQIATASTPMSAAQRSWSFDFNLRMASATSVEKINGAPATGFSAATSSTLVNAAATVASVATQTTYVSLTTTMSGTTDKPQVGYVGLEILP